LSYPAGETTAESPSISFESWDTVALDTTAYLEFQVATTGKDSITINFKHRRSSTGPSFLELHYSLNGTDFFPVGSPSALPTDTNWHTIFFELSSFSDINDKSNVVFRLYGYGATNSGGTWRIDEINILGNCIPPPPGTGNISIVNKVNDLDSIDSNVCANVVFKLEVTNDGGADATNIRVQDILPPELQYISHTSGMSYDDGSGMWEVGDLAAGETKILAITARLMASGSITNYAEVLNSSSTNNSDESVINSAAGTNSDLRLEQTWNRSTTTVGAVNLVVTVYNDGPDPATGVQVLDKLPSGLTYVSHTSTPSGTGMTYNSSSGIWTVGNLANGGGSATLTIVAKVDKDGDATDNTAKIYNAGQCDLNTANNETTQEVLVADLSVSQVMDVAGSNAVFRIMVTNNGPDDATNITIKNSKLAASYTYVSDGSTAGSYNSATGDWTIPALLDGDSATLTVTTTFSSSLAVNWAQVSAVKEVDPDSRPDNCSGTLSSCTEDDDAGAPSADLYMTQTVDNPNPNIGNKVTFSITVSNAGIADTTNVQVKTSLPSGLTYVSNDQGTAYAKGIWTVGSLSRGASRTMKITATVSALGITTNSAEVWSSDQDDPDSTPANGSTSEDDYAGATVTSYRSILINEIAWGGTAASAEDEWIELYNPSNAAINVTDWVLKSASGSLNITLSGTIRAGGYFLLERDDNSTISDISADQVYTSTGSFSNLLSDTGESLTLWSGTGYFIDTANGNGDVWPQGSALPRYNYGSMERVGTTAESDETWVTNIGTPRTGLDAESDPIYGTPKRVNSAGIAATPTVAIRPTVVVPVGRPVINEFLARPGFDWNQDDKVDVFDEFIEIKNIGAADINIGSWKLDDEANSGSNPFTLPNITLKPGERAVFYGMQTNILLSDGGDTVRLLNASNKVYDAYTYAIAKVEDQSVCRLSDGHGLWYEDCVPTPNRINSQEGDVPSMPGGEEFESPVCDLPDTLPSDFLFAECRGYGADIWRSFFWDQFGWQGEQSVPENLSKRESFVE
jgi:uncharacterized repeat protein (TIGR01451 family)